MGTSQSGAVGYQRVAHTNAQVPEDCAVCEVPLPSADGQLVG